MCAGYCRPDEFGKLSECEGACWYVLQTDQILWVCSINKGERDPARMGVKADFDRILFYPNDSGELRVI